MEDVALNEPIGRVKANDLDIGENAKSSYDIIEGDGMDIFEITTDAQTQDGIIRVRKVNHISVKNHHCLLYVQLPSQTLLCKVLDFQGFFYLWMRCQASGVMKRGVLATSLRIFVEVTAGETSMDVGNALILSRLPCGHNTQVLLPWFQRRRADQIPLQWWFKLP